MFSDQGGAIRAVQSFGRRTAAALLVLLAGLLSVLTLCASLGLVPWPELALSFDGRALPAAGMWLQLFLTLLSVSLLFWLPANSRMTRLESGHRSFAMGVEDVSRAYRLAHAADRSGVFSLSSEFDSVRARMEQLRQHPDFSHLEPELLQLAAQMSHETRELARAYSDVRVARAKTFLSQRQEEVAALTDRLQLARATCDELRRWLTDIESEERQAQLQLKRLEADLREILPGLGYSVDFEDRSEAAEGNVVALPKAAPIERPTERPIERMAERSPIRPERPEPRG